MKTNPPEKRLSKADYELLADFRFRLRAFLRFSEEASHAVGLTPQQHQALLAVTGYPGRDSLTIGELAERLMIRHNSAVGLVDRMEEQGLVVREESKEDRRVVYVRLTETASKLVEQLSQAHQWELAQIGGVLRDLLERIEKINR